MRCCCRKLAEGPVRGSRHAVARLAPSSRDPQSLAPCSPPSRPLRAASGGGLRPALTAAALGAPSRPRSGRRNTSVEQRNSSHREKADEGKSIDPVAIPLDTKPHTRVGNGGPFITARHVAHSVVAHAAE